MVVVLREGVGVGGVSWPARAGHEMMDTSWETIKIYYHIFGALFSSNGGFHSLFWPPCLIDWGEHTK